MVAAAMAAVVRKPAPAPPARGARPARLAAPALAEALTSCSPPAGWERGADSRRAGSEAAQTSPTSPSSAWRPRERSRPTAPWLSSAPRSPIMIAICHSARKFQLSLRLAYIYLHNPNANQAFPMHFDSIIG
eukprot:scaffold32403_cov73-Phaeocystis_antarctica.AAC.2